MTAFKRIEDFISEAKKKDRDLNLDETIHILKAIKEISLNKVLIEKIIYLVLLAKKEDKIIDTLTIREDQIFGLIGHGFTSAEIAAMLTISESTVATHRKNIIKKLKLSGSGQLRRLAYKYSQENSLINKA